MGRADFQTVRDPLPPSPNGGYLASKYMEIVLARATPGVNPGRVKTH
jgi:hypothetical protein